MVLPVRVFHPEVPIARWWRNRFASSSSRPAGSPMSLLVSYSRDIILRTRSHSLPGPWRSAVLTPSPSVVAFDTPERQQWHSLLPSFFATPSDTQEHATLHPSTSLPSQVRLQEVTGVLSQTFQCPSVMPSDLHHTHCPTYSHVNKSDSNLQDSCVRAEAQGAQTASHTPTVVTQPSVPHSSSYESKFMRYAKDGMPTCALCLRRFAEWPPFLNHHHTNSCPAIAHADSQSTAPSGAFCC